MLLTIPDLIGHLHPVLVHLPIGILLLACFFQLLAIRSRFTFLQPAIPVMLGWGVLSAIASCISGYLLSLSGDYEGNIVYTHQVLGITVAIVSFILYLLYKLCVREMILRWVSVALIILITVTGHYGGTLTHGEGYLTEGWNDGKSDGPALKPIANIQAAAVYGDIVQPLFQARCYNCHGPNKQKGKLRLDGQEQIFKGGEDGKVIVPGKTDESKLLERLLLPLNDKDHMPPREKPQLTESEITLLHWWISTGADFNKRVDQLEQTDKIKPVLASFESGKPADKAITDVPAEPVVPGDSVIIHRLRNANVIVIPVGQGSNYLSINFVTATTGADTLVKLLRSLEKQLVWLKLDNAAVSDKAMDDIAACHSLTRLQLSNTNITDAGVAKLAALSRLQSLNLVGTKVTAQGLMPLKAIKGLQHLYLYQTGIVTGDWMKLKQQFPTTQLDSGRYLVSSLPTDTIVVKAPVK